MRRFFLPPQYFLQVLCTSDKTAKTNCDSKACRESWLLLDTLLLFMAVHTMHDVEVWQSDHGQKNKNKR